MPNDNDDKKDNKYDIKSSRSRRKSERAFVLTRLKGVFLRCQQLTRPETRVINISETGLGIDSSFLTPQVSTLKTINGHLLVGKTVTPVTLKLVRVNSGIAGFEFVQPKEMVQAAIRVYFEAEIVGASLKLLEETPQGLKLDDGQSNTLEIEMKNEKIIRLAIGFFGNQVVWNHEGGELNLIQNTQLQPIGSFLRKQLIQLVLSADTLKPDLQKQVEKILMGINT